MKKSNYETKKGFTIVEVMIVLAIAGIIMLLVFLAVPALQRNSRNSSRRSDASHLMGLVNEYMSNHNGQAPTGFSIAATTPAGSVDLKNESFSAFTKPTTITPVALTATTWAAPASPALDTAYVYTNLTCNNNIPAPSGGVRAVTTVFYVEPGKTLQCVGT